MKLSIIVPVYNTEKYIERCLDSIELINDIEIIIIDDCSTDSSLEIVKKWISKVNFKNITLIHNNVNLGVGATVNKGYNIMQGEYVLTLCDDDYLLEPISKFVKQLTGEDLVYFDLITNNGKRWDGIRLPGSTKAYKRTIIGSTRRLNQNFGGDKVFYEEILKKNPSKKQTKILLYHYNRPREGSLMWQWENLDITIFTIAYNGYGRFLSRFLDNIERQTIESKGIVVLGKEHGAKREDINRAKKMGVQIIYERKDSTMGYLYNLAVNNANSEWMLKVDIDDELMSNAVEEVRNKKDNDAVALKYYELSTGGVEKTKYSAIIDDYLRWQETNIPGYIAVKRKYNNEVLYYEDIEIPNYPFLFQIKYLNMKAVHTDNVCAVYIRRDGSHGDIAKKTKKREQYFKYLNNRAMYYYNLTTEQTAKEPNIIKKKTMIFRVKNQRFRDAVTKQMYRPGKLFEIPYDEQRRIYIESNNLAEYIETREEVVYNVSGKSN